MSEQKNDHKYPTVGERIVDIDFNHATGETKNKVTELKQLAAQMINIVSDDADDRVYSQAGADVHDFHSGAIQSILEGQMAAVKAVTRPRKEGKE